MEGETLTRFDLDSCFDDDIDDDETFTLFRQQDTAVNFDFPSPETWILNNAAPLVEGSTEITTRVDVLQPSSGIEEQKTEIKRSQSQNYRKRKVQLLCEKKRRDKLREKLRCLKELLPTTGSKLDQATLLDEAAKHIRLLQSQLQVFWTMIQGTSPWPCHVPGVTAAGSEILQPPGFYQFPYPFSPRFFYPRPRTCPGIVETYAGTTEPFSGTGLLQQLPGAVPWAYQGECSSQFPHYKQLQ